MSIKIMSAIFESETLGPTERLIMLALADHADDSGRCYPSIDRLCQRTGLSERAIQTNIRKLSEQGYVRIIPGGGKSRPNIYFVSATPASETPHLLHPAAETPFLVRANPASAALNPAADAPEPSGTTIEPSTEAAEGARARNPAGSPGEVIDRITHALGFDTRGIVPKYWAGADAPVIVGRWMTELHLTPDEIVRVAQANAVQHGSPAQGPKILTQHMASFAEAKTAPMAPSQPARASPPPGKTNRELGEIAMAKLEEQNRLRATR